MKKLIFFLVLTGFFNIEAHGGLFENLVNSQYIEIDCARSDGKSDAASAFKFSSLDSGNLGCPMAVHRYNGDAQSSQIFYLSEVTDDKKCVYLAPSEQFRRELVCSKDQF